MSKKADKQQQRQVYHRNKTKKTTSNSTPGKVKGIKASPLQRTLCARNRSYKYPNYLEVLSTLGKRTGKTS